MNIIKSSKLINILVCLTLLIMSIPISAKWASAVGMSPAHLDIDFVPGFDKNFTFYVRGTSSVPTNILVNVTRKALKDYITVYNPLLENVRQGEKRYFKVNIKLPEEMDRPGTHMSYIEAMEVATFSGGGMVALTNVIAPVWVHVPYPGKYVDIALEAPNVLVSKPVNFTVRMSSEGKKNATAVTTINVYDINKNKIATVNPPDVFIEAETKAVTRVAWKTIGMKPGLYMARAITEYGGENPANSKTNFKIGDIIIEIVNITSRNVTKGEIIKFGLELRSIWNERIENVYVTLNITDADGKLLNTQKSTYLSFRQWSSDKLDMYWDSGENEPGKYKAIFTVHFLDKQTRKVHSFKISPEQTIDYLFLILAVIIAIVLITIFILYRKIKKKGDTNRI